MSPEQAEYLREHKKHINTTYEKIIAMKTKWEKECAEPVDVVAREIGELSESLGMFIPDKDIPDFDDPKAEEKMKVLNARVEKIYAENEGKFKVLEAKVDQLSAAATVEYEKIKKAADDLKSYVKNKLDHSGEICPYCKGKGKISLLSDEKRADLTSFLGQLNF